MKIWFVQLVNGQKHVASVAKLDGLDDSHKNVERKLSTRQSLLLDVFLRFSRNLFESITILVKARF